MLEGRSSCIEAPIVCQAKAIAELIPARPRGSTRQPSTSPAAPTAARRHCSLGWLVDPRGRARRCSDGEDAHIGSQTPCKGGKDHPAALTELRLAVVRTPRDSKELHAVAAVLVAFAGALSGLYVLQLLGLET